MTDIKNAIDAKFTEITTIFQAITTNVEKIREDINTITKTMSDAGIDAAPAAPYAPDATLATPFDAAATPDAADVAAATPDVAATPGAFGADGAAPLAGADVGAAPDAVAAAADAFGAAAVTAPPDAFADGAAFGATADGTADAFADGAADGAVAATAAAADGTAAVTPNFGAAAVTPDATGVAPPPADTNGAKRASIYARLSQEQRDAQDIRDAARAAQNKRDAERDAERAAAKATNMAAIKNADNPDTIPITADTMLNTSNTGTGISKKQYSAIIADLTKKRLYKNGINITDRVLKELKEATTKNEVQEIINYYKLTFFNNQVAGTRKRKANKSRSKFRTSKFRRNKSRSKFRNKSNRK